MLTKDHTQEFIGTALATLRSEFKGLWPDYDDIAQEAVIQFWEKLGDPSGIPENAPKALLRTITKRRAIDHYRKINRRNIMKKSYQSECISIEELAPQLGVKDLKAIAAKVMDRFRSERNESKGKMREFLVAEFLIEHADEEPTDEEIQTALKSKISKDSRKRIGLSLSSVTRARRKVRAELASALKDARHKVRSTTQKK